MDTTVILQVITVAVATITLFIDYVYNAWYNRRNRTYEIVGKELSYKLDKFRDAYAQILSLTHDITINSIKGCNQKFSFQNSAYVYNLNLARSQVRTNTLPFWDKEHKLHESMDKLCKMAITYYETPTKVSPDDLRKLRDEFFVECSIYDWAMWEYEQTQVRGKAPKRVDLDRHYYNILTRIHNSGSGQTLKFKEAFSGVYDSFMETVQNEHSPNEENEDKKEEQK